MAESAGKMPVARDEAIDVGSDILEQVHMEYGCGCSDDLYRYVRDKLTQANGSLQRRTLLQATSAVKQYRDDMCYGEEACWAIENVIKLLERLAEEAERQK